MIDHIQISISDPDYPSILTKAMGSKAPKTFSFAGNLGLLKMSSVGFCGSRKASEQGLAAARDCASQAAELGIAVVSGNAAGVDVEAHFHALANGGATILVLPEGIENFRIRKVLQPVWDWDRVLVLSQFEPQHGWRAYRAMARNKVIIGLSGAMIVIEAGNRGGTLDAGKSTLEMGLPLFVTQYEQASSDAGGNETLMQMGGVPLFKLRSTNRANMAKVQDALQFPNSARAQPKLC
jgi:DNA processing protein